ncbi:plasmalemma vesicle associated protein b [Maylandia zebra]|uniref:Plasmalemma vesicle-associated protein n=3 Tax=Haplochromini TaxID=319058 RepID=A0A3B4G6N5_9CICH|nr:PREDICTED: plasmalemma vesicle-associated protein [Pundamilia nyererei]XP_012775246.1 plasmalemma vesicle-associated protein [Maylandia zebra]XP_026002148.1 plasmalemma vesicle-associated protein [Astatotilapia calliptera]
MYSSSYSRAKLSPGVRHLNKSKAKSCGYYMRIVFLFSSLIQSLIIVSLVLFVIYGQPEKTAADKRVKELELGFNKLSDNNIELRKEKSKLEAQLKARAEERAALEKEMAKQQIDANKTEQDLKKKSEDCNRLLNLARRPLPPIQPHITRSSTSSELSNLKRLYDQQEAKLDVVNSNFTQTVQNLRDELDTAVKDRTRLNDEVVELRRDNTFLREQHALYTSKCKEDFANSLEGITTVTREFLDRINKLFPHQLTFHLTCSSQREHMDKIKNSCTNLSRDVENKFQVYLDNVGKMVSEIQEKSSQLEVKNKHLISDFEECQRNHSEFVEKTSKQSQIAQKAHDDKVEKLLQEKEELRQQLSNMKPGAKPAGFQASSLQGRHTPTNWTSVGITGIFKAPTVK